MYQTRFTEKVRFNQLEEGDLFTFRKNGILTGDPLDELLRYDWSWCDNGNDWHDCNVLDYGGGHYKINNTRCWVWRVPNKKKKKENKLKPIECKIRVMTYTEGWKNVCEFEKVAISVRDNEKDIIKALEYNDRKTVSMTKEQYETSFEPLFNEIKELNRLINSMS